MWFSFGSPVSPTIDLRQHINQNCIFIILNLKIKVKVKVEVDCSLC